jgi:putative transcriptional regulator
MPISYRRLFHLLIDRNIKEGEFRRLAGISAPTLGKLKSGETITTEMICKICKALNCQPEDIMEYIPENEKAPE